MVKEFKRKKLYLQVFMDLIDSVNLSYAEVDITQTKYLTNHKWGTVRCNAQLINFR